MPWQESCAVDERIRFISEHNSGSWTMTELCERHGISRKTGYKWLDRYRMGGPAGLAVRSSAPRVHGRATADHLVEAIEALRDQRPHWGPRKIVAKLIADQPEIRWPSASTVGEILKRAGKIEGPAVSAASTSATWPVDGAAACQPRVGGGSQRLGALARWLARRTVDDDGW